MCARPRGLVECGFPGDSNEYGEVVPPEGVRSALGGDPRSLMSFGTPRLERFPERGVGGPRRADLSEVLDMFDEERWREVIVMSMFEAGSRGEYPQVD